MNRPQGYAHDRAPLVATTLSCEYRCMSMHRVRCVWSGWPGAPGYTNFFVGTAIVNQTAIRAFFGALAGILPSTVSIQVPDTGDVVDETDGTITGVWSGTSSTLLTGLISGVYASPAGACVNWRSGLIVAGRRVMGRSFLVPLAGAAFQNDGTLSTSALGDLQSAATNLISALAGELKVWSRPRPALTGQAATVISSNVPDKAVVLRSRR